MDFEKVQSKKLSKDDLILDCTESDDIMGNETIAKNNMESEIDICENDDTFEIAVLNDKQLEIKKIIIWLWYYTVRFCNKRKKMLY